MAVEVPGAGGSAGDCSADRRRAGMPAWHSVPVAKTLSSEGFCCLTAMVIFYLGKVIETDLENRCKDTVNHHL